LNAHDVRCRGVPLSNGLHRTAPKEQATQVANLSGKKTLV